MLKECVCVFSICVAHNNSLQCAIVHWSNPCFCLSHRAEIYNTLCPNEWSHKHRQRKDQKRVVNLRDGLPDWESIASLRRLIKHEHDWSPNIQNNNKIEKCIVIHKNIQYDEIWMHTCFLLENHTIEEKRSNVTGNYFQRHVWQMDSTLRVWLLQMSFRHCSCTYPSP